MSTLETARKVLQDVQDGKLRICWTQDLPATAVPAAFAECAVGFLAETWECDCGLILEGLKRGPIPCPTCGRPMRPGPTS